MTAALHFRTDSMRPRRSLVRKLHQSTMVFHVPKPRNEIKRLAALARYRILDTPAQAAFDDFAALAAHICGTPIGLVNLVADARQWTLATVGLEVKNTPREHAFCSYTIMGTGPMVVEDAAVDYRFAGNPLVTDDPNIRFYAGAPLIDADGFALGSLCAIDRKPRAVSSQQIEALHTLSRRLMAQLELHRTSQELATALEEIRTLRGLVPLSTN